MGRALVPKTSFSRFESCHPCQSFFQSEHGIAAGASAFQADDASSTLAARSRRSSYRSSTPDRQSGSTGAIPVLRSKI